MVGATHFALLLRGARGAGRGEIRPTRVRARHLATQVVPKGGAFKLGSNLITITGVGAARGAECLCIALFETSGVKVGGFQQKDEDW